MIVRMNRTRRPIDILFPAVRQQVLAATLLNPERSWYLRELAAQLHVTPSSLQTELQNLVDAGILKKTANGNRAYFQADQTSPIFVDLHNLIKKSLGAVEEIKTALLPLANDIDVAFIYGSYARVCDVKNSSDIDLMVIGNATGMQLAEALSPVEEAVGREVNPTIYTRKEFNEKVSSGHHFLSAVLKTETLPIIGDMDVLAAASNSRQG